MRNYNIRGQKRVYAIGYGPAYGKDLNTRLSWEYYENLEKEYGISDPETIEQDKVPEEF